MTLLGDHVTERSVYVSRHVARVPANVNVSGAGTYEVVERGGILLEKVLDVTLL